MIETDYLVIGAGAMGMAYVDTILADTSDATITIVDRGARPGGHWNFAYPFVRLHQPSAFYGVNSRPLGTDRKDTEGFNAGLYELASGAEVLAYYDQVLHQQFIPSGRVTYLALHDVEPPADGATTVRCASLTTGEVTEISVRNKIVNASYMNVSVPSQRPPKYEIANGVRHGPINDLATLTEPSDSYTVIGAGKTGADACLWLLRHGVAPSAIRWVMPRDSWYLDRARVQPGDFFETTAAAFVEQFLHVAESTSIPDLFDRLEGSGLLVRLDPDVEPTMYRCSTMTTSELDQLRQITNVVRLGRVQSIGIDEIVLDGGSIPTSASTLHVNCTADGLERRPIVPIFDGNRVTLQPVRMCQQVFSAAFIAHVEAGYDDEAHKNSLCGVIPHPDAATDWVRTAHAGSLNSAAWGADAALTEWLAQARLDGFSTAEPPTDDLVMIMLSALDHAELALTKLEQYVTELDAT